jgi:hypothetical protein
MNGPGLSGSGPRTERREMTVYCVKNERGWLFREAAIGPVSGAPEGDENALALMVYLTEEDAFADALADPEVVATS